ncbi:MULTISPECIES: hypothetical protein [unclassified Myxococcus]|uniref:hypothetical protein n=1 Tax=unclassified Myxococcus TaxID=2648731 RepID=UPI00157B2AE7|nr:MULTISPECIES: hypothetical protein [unclassified Myxococcus]NTX50895.1 hypothetical protein [Myxococcus sp. CA039A]
MTSKLMQGLLLVAALALPTGSALAFCQDGDTQTCLCPDGSMSVRYCVNSRFGPCECGGGLGGSPSLTEEASAAEQATSEASTAQVCIESLTLEQSSAPSGTPG